MQQPNAAPESRFSTPSCMRRVGFFRCEDPALGGDAAAAQATAVDLSSRAPGSCPPAPNAKDWTEGCDAIYRALERLWAPFSGRRDRSPLIRIGPAPRGGAFDAARWPAPGALWPSNGHRKWTQADRECRQRTGFHLVTLSLGGRRPTQQKVNHHRHNGPNRQPTRGVGWPPQSGSTFSAPEDVRAPVSADTRLATGLSQPARLLPPARVGGCHCGCHRERSHLRLTTTSIQSPVGLGLLRLPHADRIHARWA